MKNKLTIKDQSLITKLVFESRREIQPIGPSWKRCPSTAESWVHCVRQRPRLPEDYCLSPSPSVLHECIQITLPWFFSFNKFFVAGKNISISSGTFLMTWTAQSAAYKKKKKHKKDKRRFISIKVRTTNLTNKRTLSTSSSTWKKKGGIDLIIRFISY